MRTLLALLLMISPAMAAEMKEMIQERNDAFAEIFNSGDASQLGRSYTEDAYLLPAGAPLQQGREAIVQFWQSGIDGGMADLKLEVVDVADFGDTAREIGQFSLSSGDKPMSGKYLVVWRNVDGEWLMESDIWNMNE